MLKKCFQQVVERATPFWGNNLGLTQQPPRETKHRGDFWFEGQITRDDKTPERAKVI